ncbi:prepilin-type N-terminal cleavage/methylation domain-containing protein [Marinospirillum sp.]|uniref:PulJ/GspJ family protein n=1 Tax=Marinospirillum sp. TaxID=2183934 RepID=UPI0028707D67|nr:prepilin-type N-terminal cleavage/methylation domain-containing protein [Marinospirillum sp.]MDR9466825.1 prepilin-type N-terminal cleavage/methylation domain-containing protein [Marinospirillum sp.]
MSQEMPRQTGFTLMELLVALILTALLAITVGQHLTSSLQIRLLIQQEAAAARAAEDLALQLGSGISPPGSLKVSLKYSQCSPEHPKADFDFSLLCQTSQDLPDLKAKRNGPEIVLTWQGPTGSKEIRRPTQ